MHATVNPPDLMIETQIGTYGPGSVIPGTRSLDLGLTIDPAFVFIDQDGMKRVVDYDPLIGDIDRLAPAKHSHTQERPMTRMVQAAANYPEISEISVRLCKTSLFEYSGEPGLTLVVDADDLANPRQQKAAA